MILDFRKGRILAAIVESYIRSGEPVGSKVLAELLGNCVSSATIRNDMAVLTAAGYLAQPHTSAGRLPTPSALRWYVEEMMDRRPLTLQEKVDIKSALSAVSGDAARMQEEACRVLADLTGLCAMACRPDHLGNGISRIVGLGHCRQRAYALDHIHNLRLLGSAVADNRLLNLQRSVFKNLNSGLSAGKKYNAPAVRNGNTGSNVSVEKQFLYGNRIRLE